MKYEFNVFQTEANGNIYWVAKSKILKGCVGQGETAEEAILELNQNEKEWLLTAKQFNIPIPMPVIKKDIAFSGKVSLRMSPLVHEEAFNNAKELGISLNQYINDSIIEHNAKHHSRFYSILDQSDIEISLHTTKIIDMDSIKYTSNIKEEM